MPPKRGDNFSFRGWMEDAGLAMFQRGGVVKAPPGIFGKRGAEAVLSGRPGQAFKAGLAAQHAEWQIKAMIEVHALLRMFSASGEQIYFEQALEKMHDARFQTEKLEADLADLKGEKE